MTEYLEKNAVVFRGDNGELLAQTLELELLPNPDGSLPKIKAVPLTRGQLKRLFGGMDGANSTKDQDMEILTKHCVQPKFEEQDLDDMTQNTIQAIIYAIMSASTGVPQHKIKENAIDKINEFIDKQEEVLQKN